MNPAFEKNLSSFLILFISFLNSIILVYSNKENAVVFILLTLISLLALWALVDNISKVIKERGKVFKDGDRKGINKYLTDFIRKGGKTIILTRDLSWVDSREVEDLLFSKARADELTIIMEHENEISRSLLLAHDVDIRYYQGTKYEDIIVKKRLTIINWETPNSRITIPTVSGEYHENKEYTYNESVYHITKNYIDIILRELPRAIV